MTTSIQEQMEQLGFAPSEETVKDIEKASQEVNGENPFTFSVEDCVQMRKAVLRFYEGICNLKEIPNTVDMDDPCMDVLADFQLLMYIYMLMEANRQIEWAGRIQKRNGEYVVRQRAKSAMGYLKNDMNRILRHSPMNSDLTFTCQYADIDEQISDRVERIVHQTYYSLLNNMLKESDKCESEVLHAICHIVTGMILAILSCEKGMGDNHRVPSPLLYDISKRMIVLADSVNKVNRVDLFFNEERLEKTITDTMNVVITMTNKTMAQIYGRAKSLDLTPYLQAAKKLVRRKLRKDIQQQ